MREKMPVEARSAQQEIMQMLRQFRLDQELETFDFIEIRNRFEEAFKLLATCLNDKDINAPSKEGVNHGNR